MWLLPGVLLLAASSRAIDTDIRRTTTEPRACPSGWVNGQDLGCFSFLNEETNLTWPDAMKACEKVGGYLAEMKTTSQLELLSGLAGMEEQFTGIQNWWIGLSDFGHEGTWVWVHSFQEVSETFWSHGSPSEKPDNELDCGFAQLNNDWLTWKDLDCGSSQVHEGAIAPLCQRDMTTEDPTTTTTATSTTAHSTTPITTNPPVTECPEDWREFEESCYRLYQEEMSWPAAEEACGKLHPAAHLASVSSSAENKMIASMYGACCYVWLGGSDSSSEGDWTWSDGSAMDYTHWWQGEGHGGPEENCLGLNTYLRAGYGDHWFDMSCDDENYFVCEINMS